MNLVNYKSNVLFKVEHFLFTLPDVKHDLIKLGLIQTLTFFTQYSYLLSRKDYSLPLFDPTEPMESEIGRIPSLRIQERKTIKSSFLMSCINHVNSIT